ncbi:biosynthetic peptidoglycan transglycosylase [Myxococcus sp. CA039A]|uniref:transglycosylase domain-containing protein n=1 Tax=Myxococcus sp. CA039A TaxID=2741737 RepID=UPI00157B2B92|nr:transglycosylase domain-containing protein [Myxococcus sp. CA039A]
MFRRLARGTLVLLAIVGIPFALYVTWVSHQLPSVSRLGEENPERTNYMRLAISEGQLPENFAVTWLPLSSMSNALVCGVVKAEDTIFFQHRGFNYRQTLLAIHGRLNGRVVGHSTITMQLARNLFLGPEQTFERKLREILLTRDLEREVPKQRILQLYLNIMELGPGVWGVGQASQYYFQKQPAQLDAFEGTLLAAIAPAPRQPLEGPNRERARKKQASVLWRMFISGLLGPEQYQSLVLRHQVLFQALEKGVPLQEALRLPTPADVQPPPVPFRVVTEEIPEERMLEESCGYRSELGYYTGPNPVPKF